MSNQKNRRLFLDLFPERMTLTHLVKSIFFKHGVVSVISAILDFSIFISIVSYSNTSIFFAHLVGFSIATIFGFVAHSFYTFELGDVSLQRFFYFLLQIVLVFFTGFLILTILIDLKFAPFIAKPFQLFCTFFMNLLIGRFFTFRKN